MYKFKLHLILATIILFCCITNSKGTLKPTTVNSITIIDSKITISDKEFSSQLKAQKIMNFPFRVSNISNAPLGNINSCKEFDVLRNFCTKQDTSLTKLDKYYRFKDINDIDEINNSNTEIDYSSHLLFLKRFKPINDSIEVLLFSTDYVNSSFGIWIIATFDVKNMKKIDNAIVGVFLIQEICMKNFI